MHNIWLIIGGVLSGFAALMHIAIIFGGPDWYRFFGAGEQMAVAAGRGAWYPAVVTFGIAMGLAICAAYAFAGAGLLPKLPLMRSALVAISGVYLLRGLALFPVLMLKPDLATPFILWSSLIVLVYGAFYAIGTWRAWPMLSNPV